MLETAHITFILKEYYHLKTPTLSKMEGYDSLNFKVSTPTAAYVLKIYSYSKETEEQIKAENEILALLEKKSINCSKVVAATSGDLYVTRDIFIYRLLTFLTGDFLAKAKHSNALLTSFGATLGTMDKVLSTQTNYIIKAKKTRWDLKYFQKNWKYLLDIPNAQDRSLVHYFCLQFKEHILPIQYDFRQGIIHNDANDWNVLTHDEQLSGIIDFGDMCHSWVINELAVALTYVLMEKENPIAIAATVIRPYHKIHPLEINELDALYYLIAARLCTSVLNSAHTKKLRPDSDYITVSEKSAWKLLKKWVSINPIKAHNTFRTACGYGQLEKKPLENQLLQREENTCGSLSLSYKKPIQMTGAAFQYMYDADGNTYLDAYNNILQVGHCHPTVVEAGQRTMAKLNTNTRYLYEELTTYTDKLLSKFPSKLNKVFLVNSGSAASDLAIRIAKTHTGKKKVMVMEHGYHGNTQNGIDISHYKYNHKGGTGKATNIVEAALPKCFGSHLETEEAITEAYLNLAQNRINEHKNKIAAFIAEPIVGCGGQVPLPRGYLTGMYAKIREQGGVCISDEVQVGFGRLGRYFWGYELHDVIPDIVVLGKPIGNGHPMGAVVTTTELSNSFNNGMEFFSSFGGNPVSCAIGEAVLSVLDDEELPGHAFEVGKYLEQELRTLQAKYPELADIRGAGLFLGVEILGKNGIPGTNLAAHIKNQLRLHHILISTDGPFNNVLKIKPPLYFNRKNVDQLIQQLDEILKKQKKINTFSTNK